MGGYGSGRQWGRPLADTALRINFAWMLRRGLAMPGRSTWGTLRWSRGDEPAGSIGYHCDMRDPDAAWLELNYTVTDHWSGEKTDYRQRIGLSYTVPHYGGKRWWMHCPSNGARVAKLYKPAGGNTFASRKAWRIGYQSQRVSRTNAPFERLFKLQRRLGSEQGWGAELTRPKGMHRRTFERHLDRYWQIDEQCTRAEMISLASLATRFGLEP